jgi:hypothetical protein
MLHVTYVKSLECYGCGIAGAAMLAGVSYDRMRRAIWPKKNHERHNDYYCQTLRYYDRSDGTTVEEEVKGLEHLGCKVLVTRQPEKYFNKHRVSVPMFFYDNYDPELDCGHTFVWDPIRLRFFDPSYNTPLHNDVYKRGFERVKKYIPAIVLLKGQLA